MLMDIQYRRLPRIILVFEEICLSIAKNMVLCFMIHYNKNTTLVYIQYKYTQITLIF
jgi:hypothetical protein